MLVPYGDIKAPEAQMDDDVCAVLFGAYRGEGGVHVPPDEYLQQVRALCDKHDALLIFDEVQTGVARTGKWFAYMHSGVKPDVLTFAKGIGGGFLLQALLCRSVWRMCSSPATTAAPSAATRPAPLYTQR